jgi:hypothetical protein
VGARGGADAQTRLLGFIGRDPFWPGPLGHADGIGAADFA